VADDLVVSALAAGVVPGLGLLAVLVRVAGVDAHPLQETVVAIDVDGDDLVVVVVEHRDDRVGPAEAIGGVLADELARLHVVRRVGDVHRAGRSGNGVERDEVEACLPGLRQFGVHRIAVRGDDDALVPAGDRVVDRADLSLGVTVLRTGGNGEFHAILGASCLASFSMDTK
jgi:hypothetical protein